MSDDLATRVAALEEWAEKAAATKFDTLFAPMRMLPAFARDADGDARIPTDVHRSVCVERDDLRAQLAAVTAERDRLARKIEKVRRWAYDDDDVDDVALGALLDAKEEP